MAEFFYAHWDGVTTQFNRRNIQGEITQTIFLSTILLWVLLLLSASNPLFSFYLDSWIWGIPFSLVYLLSRICRFCLGFFGVIGMMVFFVLGIFYWGTFMMIWWLMEFSLQEIHFILWSPERWKVLVCRMLSSLGMKWKQWVCYLMYVYPNFKLFDVKFGIF